MAQKIGLLLFAVLLLLLVSPAPALAFADDVGAWMIKKGIDLSIYSIGDSMIQVGNGNSSVNRTAVPGLIFSTITFTIDPYAYSWVKDWWKTMLVFYVMITILAITGGGAWALICRIAPDVAYRFAWLTGENPGAFKFKIWMSSVALALVFPYLTLFGVYFILQLNYVVSAMLTTSMMTTIPPVIDNIIVYICMALAYLLLTLVMAARNIIIILMAAGSLLLAAMYLIPQLRNFVTSTFMYFLVIVFMQPIIIFSAALGFTFINNLPVTLAMFRDIMFIAMIFLLVVMGIVCLLGLSVVRSIIHLGALRI